MNLIICCTPLQVLIAEKIIDLYPNENFHGVLFSPIHNEKYQYYFTRLKEKCHRADYIDVKDLFRNKYYLLIKFISFWMKGLFLRNVRRIFLANIDVFYIHLFIGRFKEAEVITFDDGALNLNFFQNFFTRAKPQEIFSPKFLFLLRLFKAVTLKELCLRQKKHYSIYKLPNIMGETTYLDLLGSLLFIDNDHNFTKNVSILIGQPIYQDQINDKELDVNLMKKVIKDYHIEYYFPHPRENYIVDNVNYVNTPLIFEDYLTSLIRNNPNVQYVIYTFFSSVALNLSSVPNIKIVSLKPNNYSGIGEEIYNLFSKCNIEIKSIEMM